MEKRRQEDQNEHGWKQTVEEDRKQLGRKSWKVAENAARDSTKWQKLLSGLMHQLGWEEDK